VPGGTEVLFFQKKTEERLAAYLAFLGTFFFQLFTDLFVFFRLFETDQILQI